MQVKKERSEKSKGNNYFPSKLSVKKRAKIKQENKALAIELDLLTFRRVDGGFGLFLCVFCSGSKRV